MFRPNIDVFTPTESSARLSLPSEKDSKEIENLEDNFLAAYNSLLQKRSKILLEMSKFLEKGK